MSRLNYRIGDVVTFKRKVGTNLYESFGVIIGGKDMRLDDYYFGDSRLVPIEPEYTVLETHKRDGNNQMSEIYNVTEDEIIDSWKLDLGRVVEKIVKSELTSMAFHVTRNLNTTPSKGSVS